MKILKRITLYTSLGLLFFQFSCAPTPTPHLKIGSAYAINGKYYHPSIQPNYKEVGYASWYGARFHRKKTANGEVFDKNEYTAAHKTLPLPSIVKVTNLDNGRTIRVRINDRGPFVRGRIIDMSENAASALGFKGRGTAKVMVELDKKASLALLKDPRLRMKEATKKQIVEAYQNQDLRSSEFSLANLGLTSNVEKIEEEDIAPMPVVLRDEHGKANPQDFADIQSLTPSEELEPLPLVEQDIITEDKSFPPHKPSFQQVNLNLKPLAKPIAKPQLAVKNTPKVSAPKKIVATKSAPLPKKKFAIQVASTTSNKDALYIKQRLGKISSNIYQANVKGRKYYRIQVNAVGTNTDAKNLLTKIRSIGFKDAYIR